MFDTPKFALRFTFCRICFKVPQPYDINRVIRASEPFRQDILRLYDKKGHPFYYDWPSKPPGYKIRLGDVVPTTTPARLWGQLWDCWLADQHAVGILNFNADTHWHRIADMVIREPRNPIPSGCYYATWTIQDEVTAWHLLRTLSSFTAPDWRNPGATRFCSVEWLKKEPTQLDLSSGGMAQASLGVATSDVSRRPSNLNPAWAGYPGYGQQPPSMGVYRPPAPRTALERRLEQDAQDNR